MENDIVKCSFCNLLFDDCIEEIWKDESNGQDYVIQKSKQPYILGYTSIGEIVVCEKCAKSPRVLSLLTPNDCYEIFFQFGLEYRYRDDLIKSFKYHRLASKYVGKTDVYEELIKLCRILDNERLENKFLKLLRNYSKSRKV
jgi:hypothetical protein